MMKVLARGGIEFLAVLLGITGSLWIDQNQEIRREKEYQITILESIYNDIIQTEKFFIESRDLAFTADRVWMDYLSNNWDSMNVDSVAVAISKEKHSVFHTLFFDFREIHPPLSSIEMIMQDGSLKEIDNLEIRKKINKLYKTDLGFILKNVQGEIDMQIKFRSMLCLYAFFYASIHMLSYVGLDYRFDFEPLIDDVLKKKFVFIGFSAWLLLIPLAITSSDKMTRLLKQNWKKLHSLIYVVSIFGVLHFIWLSKTIFFKPLIFLIILIILLLFRINFSKLSSKI